MRSSQEAIIQGELIAAAVPTRGLVAAAAAGQVARAKGRHELCAAGAAKVDTTAAGAALQGLVPAKVGPHQGLPAGLSPEGSETRDV